MTVAGETNSNISPICQIITTSSDIGSTDATAFEVSESRFVASGLNNSTRVIAIADIHGAHNELMRTLAGAGITDGSTCAWIPQPSGGTTLIQMGDIVDRGPGAMEAWECIEALQKTPPPDSQVIRLVGNHELWWLEGHYHDRNKATDTRAKCRSITQKLRDGIINESIQASYVRRMGDVPVLFVHAGYRKQMVEHMKKKYSISGTAEELSSVTNQILRSTVASQAKAATVVLPTGEEIFEAGPERRGSHIGGPFWTDFKVLQGEADPSVPPQHAMIQVVGHTAKPGSFRYVQGLHAICIDTGMYTGTSSFLEIGYDMHFRLYKWNENLVENGGWQINDVTKQSCN